MCLPCLFLACRRAPPQARLEAAVAGALGQPLHLRDPEDEGEHPTAHEENKLAQACTTQQKER